MNSYIVGLVGEEKYRQLFKDAVQQHGEFVSHKGLSSLYEYMKNSNSIKILPANFMSSGDVKAKLILSVLCESDPTVKHMVNKHVIVTHHFNKEGRDIICQNRFSGVICTLSSVVGYVDNITVEDESAESDVIINRFGSNTNSYIAEIDCIRLDDVKELL